MNDRRPTILIIANVAVFLMLAGVLVVLVVHHNARTQEGQAILQELRDARQARYEYKVVAVQAEGHERRGEDALKFASVTPAEPELTSLGSAGWEIVTSYLEIETAYPNFGNSDYVTGLQPNVRPQRLVIVLRRRVA
jgi:hypothetical protein